MKKIRGKDTKPELVVRSLLHRLGYRYRLHRKDLPGTPDIVFASRKSVLFVHGCFWHGHGCRIGRLPKSKLDYWGPKIEANRLRDGRKEAALSEAGWTVGVVWQCGLADSAALETWLEVFLNTPKKTIDNAIVFAYPPSPESNLSLNRNRT
ncbi:DNA mismatch endonuclease (patch repair protein) [Rhizobacter sp. SG703]|nr:DNA mismatch endonuclease (patch repair protein) [Rhizobacter sp. SG703]